jgi:hypothetical protein
MRPGVKLLGCQLGVNVDVARPMKLRDFVEAVKQGGGFWAVPNELPPWSLRRSDSVGPSRLSEHSRDRA